MHDLRNFIQAKGEQKSNPGMTRMATI